MEMKEGVRTFSASDTPHVDYRPRAGVWKLSVKDQIANIFSFAGHTVSADVAQKQPQARYK